MGIFNPWGEVRELKVKLAMAEQTYEGMSAKIKTLEFTKRENEREIKLLEKELKAVKDRLTDALKNDTRDSKGRFTKATK